MTEGARGTTLDLFLNVQVSGLLTNLDALPGVVITNPSAVAVESGTGTLIGTGNYRYQYGIPVTAPLGSGWVITWSGLLSGDPVSAVEDFTVLASSASTPASGSGSPCGWDDPIQCCEIGDFDPETWASAVSASAAILWKLSGRRYGVCSVKLRPCRPRCVGDVDWWNPVYLPWSTGPWWYPLPCHCTDDPCSCSDVDTITLPGPVRSITAVEIDGEDFTFYVRRGRKLRRTDGEAWPTCQDPLAVPGQAGSFMVTYDRGIPLMDDGRRAHGEMACELAKSCTPGQTCRLPQRVTSITRQGVSMALLDPQDFLDDGRTGLYFVDLWLKASNPAGLQANSRVYRADA